MKNPGQIRCVSFFLLTGRSTTLEHVSGPRGSASAQGRGRLCGLRRSEACVLLLPFETDHAWESPVGPGGVSAFHRVAMRAGRWTDGGRHVARLKYNHSPQGHLIVTRSEGSICSIKGRREQKLLTLGIFFSSRVCRTPPSLSGSLRRDFRRCMASVL